MLQHLATSILVSDNIPSILANQFVTFLYIKDYVNPPTNKQFWSKRGSCNLNNAGSVPRDNEASPEANQLPGV